MTQRCTYFLRIALLAIVVAVLLGAAGCGLSGGDAGSSPGAESLRGSASERAATILGRPPAGRAAKIVERGTMVVANDADFAPQSSVDSATGRPVGFNVDVAQGVADILGLDIEWQHPARATVPTGLEKGRYDASIDSMTVTEAAKKTVAFTRPYYYTWAQAFIKKTGPTPVEAADLSGRSVGVVVGTSYFDFLKKSTTAIVKTYLSDGEAAADLLDRRLDFWVTDSISGQRLILRGKPMEVAGDPLFSERRAIAVKKGEDDWRALLNYALRKMREDGSISAMSKKWYGGIDLTARP